MCKDKSAKKSFLVSSISPLKNCSKEMRLSELALYFSSAGKTARVALLMLIAVEKYVMIGPK